MESQQMEIAKVGAEDKSDQKPLKGDESLESGASKELIEVKTNQPTASSTELSLVVPQINLGSVGLLTPVHKEPETGKINPPIAASSPSSSPSSSTVGLSKIPVFPTGFDQQVSPTFLKEKPIPVTPGTKDSEGFLAPPPASTLFIRRSRTSSTGGSTYVVSKSDSTSPAVESFDVINSPQHSDESSSPHVDDIHGAPVRRRPGRPVGSTCKYKKPTPTTLEPPVHGSEVRVSSRSSSSIFKHDGSSPAINTFGSSSQWIFPLPFRPPHVSVGKPPMTGHHKPYSNVQKKDRTDNIDPLTGKRRYTKRKKIGLEKKQKGVHFEPEQQPGRPKQHLSDNGVWRPTDDFRLIVNTMAVEDLEKVFIGVKFSCYFTYKEIEDRWRKLMYGEKSSLVSQNAISALHPNVKALIYSESLFSPEEEKLISTVKNVPLSNPDISCFQTLLDENLHVFNKHRTARSLMIHWLNMRDFHMLPDQDVMDYSLSQHFEDFEEIVVDEDIQHEPVDEVIAQEMRIEDRNLKKKIRIVEDEISGWQLLIDQIMDDGRKDRTLPTLPTEFDNKTFAILRGIQVLYVMTSREITLGRSTKEIKVDADLTQEGSSNKISRKQAIIKLKDIGKFVIINKGRHPIFVDRKAVAFKSAATLHDQSVIQIANISLVFLINEPLIEKLVEWDVRREVYASFMDLETEMPSTPQNKSDN